MRFSSSVIAAKYARDARQRDSATRAGQERCEDDTPPVAITRLHNTLDRARVRAQARRHVHTDLRHRRPSLKSRQTRSRWSRCGFRPRGPSSSASCLDGVLWPAFGRLVQGAAAASCREAEKTERLRRPAGARTWCVRCFPRVPASHGSPPCPCAASFFMPSPETGSCVFVFSDDVPAIFP